MIILGIDPGIATIGFGIIERASREPKHIRHGVIRTPSSDSLSKRLLTIYNDFTELLEVFRPDVLAIEELYFQKNVNTALPVAHSRGVCMFAAEKSGLEVFEYSPQQVKLAVTGYGAAEKSQVMEMTRMLLHLSAVPRPDDAADGLAIAICHYYSGRNLLCSIQSKARSSISNKI